MRGRSGSTRQGLASGSFEYIYEVMAKLHDSSLLLKMGMHPDSARTAPFSFTGADQEAIAQSDVVVQAECGSGKSTTLVEAAGWCFDNDKTIYIVQPRCLAARRVAERVAELVGCDVGEAVGFVIGDETKCGHFSKFNFVTPWSSSSSASSNATFKHI